MGFAYTVKEQFLEILIIKKDTLLKWREIESHIPGLNKNYASVVIHKLREQYIIETRKGYGIVYRGRK